MIVVGGEGDLEGVTGGVRDGGREGGRGVMSEECKLQRGMLPDREGKRAEGGDEIG